MPALAVHGGAPVHAGGWPDWPQYDGATVAAVGAALASGRWTVSGGWTGEAPYEQVFAERFAAFCGVRHGVSTDHGSSALVVALGALGVGVGDEVVVPVLTWVASASAVLRVGAVPVFVDVDPDTGCLDAAALTGALSERTRAVVVVHLHSRMADMDAVLAVTGPLGIPVVEDCAQAHGARWGEAMAGSLGVVGAFSLQQGKVLTCGEGGVAVTDDRRLYDRMQQLRADSRRYRADPPPVGHPYLAEAGEVMGANYCLGELPAALALDQLDRLEGQLRRRADAAAHLDSALADVPGLAPLARPARLIRPSVFEYAVRRDPTAFAAAPTDVVCAAVEAELGVRVFRTDAPLHANVLYRPQTNPRWRHLGERLALPAGTRFPHAERLFDTLVLLPHRVLLADPPDLGHVVAAFAKVAAHAGEL